MRTLILLIILILSLSVCFSCTAFAMQGDGLKKDAVKKGQQPMLAPLRGVKRLLILGDSITYSGGYVDVLDTYLHLHFPAQPIEIINIGLPSETVSGLTEPNHAGGAFPRPDLHERLDRALAKLKPDMVLACYGMNDGIYYPLDAERFRKYQEGIAWLHTHVHQAGARLWLVTPPPFDSVPIQNTTLPSGRADYPSGQPYAGYDDVLTAYSTWLMTQKPTGARSDLKLTPLLNTNEGVIDVHMPLKTYLMEKRKTEPQFAFAGDGVHLNESGHRLVAREILRAWGAPVDTLPAVTPVEALPSRQDDPVLHITQLIHDRQRILADAWLTNVKHKRPGMATGFPLEQAMQKAAALEFQIRALIPTLPPQFVGIRGDYHGFDRYDFEVDGCKALVVTPRQVLPDMPKYWIWRAEFFDHRPELDLALLARGFHLAYIDVGNTFGAPSAMKHWDVFYAELTTRYGLSPKPVLEGLSRGGLYIYNWASKHPDNVAMLYGDNPVCDFKSWPGGKGKGPGSPDDWRKLQQDYGFSSEAEAVAYKKNPVDNLASLAKAHVPIIHLAGDADEVVPYPENTVLIKERYEKLGGEIKVIAKPGGKHHPHGLDDPTPLVMFIMAHLPR